jgi:hypothetical protein
MQPRRPGTQYVPPDHRVVAMLAAQERAQQQAATVKARAAARAAPPGRNPASVRPLGGARARAARRALQRLVACTRV